PGAARPGELTPPGRRPLRRGPGAVDPIEAFGTGPTIELFALLLGQFVESVVGVVLTDHEHRARVVFGPEDLGRDVAGVRLGRDPVDCRLELTEIDGADLHGDQ